mmetsp:Transcript_20858/g.62701  ORF Transcript_20858/g.62701 Transcript_20858/m.62701 type:complete len:219 (-) Transcript_20858:1909-2565(-)
MKRSVGWCTERRTEPPPSAASSSASSSSRADTASRPERGSSAIRVPPPPPARSMSSSTPTETRRRSPPERPRTCSPPMAQCALCAMPSARSVSSIAAARRGAGMCLSRRVAWSRRCSNTVEVSGSTSDWETYPSCRRRAAGERRAPPTVTAPPTAPRSLRPARIESSVDLPAPDGPIRHQRPPPPPPPLPPWPPLLPPLPPVVSVAELGCRMTCPLLA